MVAKYMVGSTSGIHRALFIDLAVLASSQFSRSFYQNFFSNLIFIYMKEKALQVAIKLTKNAIALSKVIDYEVITKGGRQFVPKLSEMNISDVLESMKKKIGIKSKYLDTMITEQLECLRSITFKEKHLNDEELEADVAKE